MKVRHLLTLLLLYGVYTETGLWTALSIGLIATNLEITAWILKGLLK